MPFTPQQIYLSITNNGTKTASSICNFKADNANLAFSNLSIMPLMLNFEIKNNLGVQKNIWTYPIFLTYPYDDINRVYDKTFLQWGDISNSVWERINFSKSNIDVAIDDTLSIYFSLFFLVPHDSVLQVVLPIY